MESKMYTVPVFTVNELFIDLIHKAIVSRGSDKKVDAIILVTNNTNVITKHAQLTLPFLTLAFGRLLFEYNRKYPPLKTIGDMFDHIITAEAGVSRTIEEVPDTRNPGQMRKRPIKDLALLPSIDDLKSRLYFFDDEPNPHVLASQIDHYIQIPPFTENPYTFELDATLNQLGGSRRKTRRRRSLRFTK